LADDDYSYLASLSAHPNRAGDTSNFDPGFAGKLAAAIRQARAQGLNVGVESGFRAPTQTGSSFDRSGRSLHSYGMAADINGIGQPGSATARQWYQIATQNGLYNPYGPQNAREWNHYQAVPNELTMADVPKFQQAFAQRSGVPAGYAGGGGSSGGGGASGSWSSGQALSQRDQHIQFIRDYAKKIGLDPDLALGIAGAEGLNAWSAKNPNAASNLRADQRLGGSYGDFQLNMGGMGAGALKAGIDPRDPSQWQAADRYALDQMKAGGVKPWSDPVARAYAATGKVQPFVAGNTINTTGGPSAGSQTGATAPAGAASGSPTTPGSWGASQPPGALQGWAGSSAGKSMAAAGKSLGFEGGEDQPPQITPPALQFGPTSGSQGGPNVMGPRQAAMQALAQQGRSTAPMPTNLLPPAGGVQSGLPSTVGAAPPGSATGMPAMGAGMGTTLNSPSQLQMAMLYGWPYGSMNANPMMMGS
jgi:hypothetical protein